MPELWQPRQEQDERCSQDLRLFRGEFLQQGSHSRNQRASVTFKLINCPTLEVGFLIGGIL